MRVLYLANRIPWFGAHTGYERLPDFMPDTGLTSKVYTPSGSLFSRAVGRAVSLLRGHGRISQADAANRARFELSLRLDRNALGHVLYGEEHLVFWRDAAASARARTLLTFHQPPSQWKPEKARALAGYPHAIVLWQRDRDWFQERLGGGTLDFIPHGVDTDFFCPALEPRIETSGRRRLLYAGIHLRNAVMLARIIKMLTSHDDDLDFDLLVPLSRRTDPGLAELRDHPRITWHAGLTDEQLRDLYRRAYLLLLPLDNSGANTAIVEALACGLPIVTTDVGGIRDYGGGTVFPVVQNNDAESMLTDPAWRDEVSLASRAFAENELAWPLIARRHADVYRRIAA
jgi:glycosyltransferase involved in cell wall biosynthesis